MNMKNLKEMNNTQHITKYKFQADASKYLYDLLQVVNKKTDRFYEQYLPAKFGRRFFY